MAIDATTIARFFRRFAVDRMPPLTGLKHIAFYASLSAAAGGILNSWLAVLKQSRLPEPRRIGAGVRGAGERAAA